jgi:hypothetical protein
MNMGDVSFVGGYREDEPSMGFASLCKPSDEE